MKENKKFFDNNRLNKGYSKTINFHQSDSSLIRKKYRHVLPPIEMIEQYEELRPGTFAQLLDMAQREQHHRHSMDLLEIEKNSTDAKLGRIFALIFVAIILVGTLALVLMESILVATLFSISAFACIALVSYLYSRVFVKREPKIFNYNRSHRKSRVA